MYNLDCIHCNATVYVGEGTICCTHNYLFSFLVELNHISRALFETQSISKCYGVKASLTSKIIKQTKAPFYHAKMLDMFFLGNIL